MSRKKPEKTTNPKKKKFSVTSDETVAGCLARMKEEGYTPVRRMEQPVFIEDNGEKVVSHQEIVFEAKRVD